MVDEPDDNAATAGTEAHRPHAEPDSPESEATEVPAPKPRRGRWLLEWLVIIVLAVAASLVLRTFVFQTFYIPSGSMEPTLQIGDRIIVSKLSVELGTIHRGDILVFKRPPNEGQYCGGPPVADLVKRVIGLPGDRLYNVGNTIYVNGQPLDQNWTHNEPIGAQQIASKSDPVVVPKNDYYMLGDNEPYSCDSRYWGPIKRSWVVGKVVFRIWPFNRIGFL